MGFNGMGLISYKIFITDFVITFSDGSRIHIDKHERDEKKSAEVKEHYFNTKMEKLSQIEMEELSESQKSTSRITS